MNHDLTVTTSVEINASPERVWKVMTKPELIKIYLHGTECITDWKVGSKVIFRGEYDGQSYNDHGIVLENRAPELLSYSYWTGFSGLPDTPENYCKVTYHIEAIKDGLTKLTWDQRGFADESRKAHSEQSMPAFVEHIKQVAEN